MVTADFRRFIVQWLIIIYKMGVGMTAADLISNIVFYLSIPLGDPIPFP